MRIVIDTSVVLSAALRDRTPLTVIDWIVRQPGWEWVATSAIVAEYIDVLGRSKFGLTPAQNQIWRSLIAENTILIVAEQEIDFPRDQHDAKFLACAIAAEAEFLITGDKDFQEARHTVTTTILSVALFQKHIIQSL